MKLPPKIVRRLILDPATVVLAALVVWFWPFVVLGVLILAVIPKVGRITRVLSVVLFYIVLESMAVVTLFALWGASGFGRHLQSPAVQRAHYRLIAWILRVLFGFGRWALKLTIVYSGAGPGTMTPDLPLIVASRHAGPGDSFILINALLNDFHRYPRIVMKETLQWDPMIDIAMNRLPMVFLSPTPFDRARVDCADESSRERLVHVLAPRPGGLFAAVDTKPREGITFVGPTGLEKFDSLRELWRGLPTHKVLVMRSWYGAPDEIPHGRAARQA